MRRAPHLVDPRNAEVWDLPTHDVPNRTYVIATTPRCGSTLLCRALWQTGQIGAPKEYLNPTQLRDWAVRIGTPAERTLHLALRGPLLHLVRPPREPAALGARLDAIRARRSGPSGWFGLKLHHHHRVRWLASIAPEALLGPIRWIHIDREDRLAQAISWVRARQTGRWIAGARGYGWARYDASAIRDAVDALTIADHAWRRFFEERRVLRLRYRDVVDDLPDTVDRVLRWLDEPAAAHAPRPELTPQADARTQAWRARWQGDVEARIHVDRQTHRASGLSTTVARPTAPSPVLPSGTSIAPPSVARSARQR